MEISQLDPKLGIPGVLRFEDTPLGLRAQVSTATCDAEVYLYGAHITRYAPRGHRELLFLSPRSSFERGKAIRGGIPIIFPWFGGRSDGRPGPAHGFARTRAWTYEGSQHTDDELSLRFVLRPGERADWEGEERFVVEARMSFGAALRVELTVRNTGEQAFSYEAALHTYLRVDDIRDVELTGLEGTSFLDKTEQQLRKTASSSPLRIGQETDQVHIATETTCVVRERGVITAVVEKQGSRSTVVWNPWIEKTAKMRDLDADSWRSFVCVESGNLGEDRVTLDGGASHTMTTILRSR